MLSLLQFPSMGHFSGFRQLQFFLSLSEFVDLLITVLLWFDIIDLTLFMQLQLNFSVFRLKILCSGFDFGKCWLMRERKHFPTFVSTFLLYGGLYQMMLHWRVLCLV